MERNGKVGSFVIDITPLSLVLTLFETTLLLMLALYIRPGIPMVSMAWHRVGDTFPDVMAYRHPAAPPSSQRIRLFTGAAARWHSATYLLYPP